MRIRAVRHRLVSVAVPFRIVSSVRDTAEQLFVLLEILTDEGLTGRSYISAFTRRRGTAVRHLIEELAEALGEMDPRDTDAAWSRMWESCRLIGHAGLSAFAISAVDVALWDVKAQALKRPLHGLLGSVRTQMPVYASDGCWLQEPVVVADQAARFAADGFGTIKLRFGRRDPKADLDALAETRRAVGASVELLVDVNQGWDVERAHTFGVRLAEHGVRWFEEPIPSEDLKGLAALRRALDLDIVAGENAYMPAGAQGLLDAEAVDVLMPDVQRIGGVTGWARTRGITREAGIPLTAHLFPEVSVHLMAAEHGGSLEYVSWLSPLLCRPLEVRDGNVSVPEGPGIGLEWDAGGVAAHEVAA